MITLTKEWLQQTIAELEEERDATPGAVNEDASNALAAMKLALASLEAESVSVNDDMAYAFHHAISDSSLGSDEVEEIKAGLRAAFANVTAPPAPVSVPAAMEMDDDFDSAFEHGKAVGWNAYRAAMLQSFGNSEQLNSPVIPDGWVLVPVEPTIAILDEFDSIIDYGAEDSKDAWSRLLAAAWIKSLPAAPQQEVESQIRKGKTVAREEWELGARLTKHRFKP